MNDSLMEQLLHEGESSSLDYKREQYPFAGATDEEKSELLKDILAFANGWRHAEAYILIGVEEVAGGRSTVVGVSHHIPENDLQQFVNTKTNRPVTFSYRAYPFEGKQVGVVTIPQQDRPIYLTKNYGKLQKHVVYYRQGTTTAVASPDDIARMVSGPAKQQASLVVEFADTQQEVALGDRITWTAEFCRMPEPKDIPALEEPSNDIHHPLLGHIHIPRPSAFDPHERLNGRYYHDLAEYEFCKRLFRKVRLVVSNTGDVPASDVRIEMIVPAKQGVVIMRPSRFPAVPKRRTSVLDMPALRDIRLRPAFRSAGDVDIDENEHRYKVEVDCGSLQPGRRVWSDGFYIGIGGSGQVQLAGRLLAGNLRDPQEFTLTIDADVSEKDMTVDELMSLTDPADDED
jgi:hypothetical protein